MRELKQNFQDACREINGEYDKDEFYGNRCIVDDSEIRLMKQNGVAKAAVTGTEEGSKHSAVITADEKEMFEIETENVLDEPAKKMNIKNPRKTSRVSLKNSEWG